jgi:hypothetical protein
MSFDYNPSLSSPSPDSASHFPSTAYTATPSLQEDLDDAPFWKEVEAFNLLPQPLIDQYYGQYVAVYNGNIVDSDFDEGELALRFYRTFGYVSVYIHKVGVEDGLVDCDDR